MRTGSQVQLWFMFRLSVNSSLNTIQMAFKRQLKGTIAEREALRFRKLSVSLLARNEVLSQRNQELQNRLDNQDLYSEN